MTRINKKNGHLKTFKIRFENSTLQRSSVIEVEVGTYWERYRNKKFQSFIFFAQTTIRNIRYTSR